MQCTVDCCLAADILGSHDLYTVQCRAVDILIVSLRRIVVDMEFVVVSFTGVDAGNVLL